MTEQKKTGNRTDHYVKPSDEKQWHERSDAPSIINNMAKEEIEMHRKNLIAMYGCDPSDITFTFERINDLDDDDRDNFIHLKYHLKCVVASKPQIREVFSIKVRIPDEIRYAAKGINSVKALPPPKLKQQLGRTKRG